MIRIAPWFPTLAGMAIGAALFAAGACAARGAEQTRLYGPDGRSVGTATTDSAGSTTFRDARGRTTGTSSTTSDGATTFRDPRGNVTGRAFTPRK
jgi:hypothetical protein